MKTTKTRCNLLRVIACINLLFLSFGTLEIQAAGNTKPHLFIKGFGGMHILKTGDFDDFYTANTAYYDTLKKDNPGYDISFTRPKKQFQGFGGEIGLETQKFAVGISVESITKEYKLDLQYQNTETGFSENRTWDYSLKAVPIFVLFHYKLIETRFLTAALTLGEGVYLIRYRDIRSQVFENSDSTFSKGTLKSRKYQLGFHGGVTLDFKVTPNIALSIDAAYRFVKLEQMNAEGIYQDDLGTVLTKGQLYYSLHSETKEARFSASKYSLPWDSRLSIMQLNGFSLKAGIKILFGFPRKSQPVKPDTDR